MNKASDPILDAFVDSLWLEKGFSQNTLTAYRSDLQQFLAWLNTQAKSLQEVTADDIQTYLFTQTQIGKTTRTHARVLSCFRSFYQYLVREKQCPSDPTRSLKSPRFAQSIPLTLSEENVSALLNAPNTKEPIGLRDKALLEVLYACGLRVSELVQLKMDQVNFQQGVLRVLGKGDKERIVPLGEEALFWLECYLKEGRSALCSSALSEFIFLSNRATAITRQAFWYRIKYYAKKIDLQVPLSPHTLRHAFATHLVNHGADLRIVQLLLGHASISTTQIYTHVAKARLQALHAKHHPRG